MTSRKPHEEPDQDSLVTMIDQPVPDFVDEDDSDLASTQLEWQHPFDADFGEPEDADATALRTMDRPPDLATGDLVPDGLAGAHFAPTAPPAAPRPASRKVPLTVRRVPRWPVPRRTPGPRATTSVHQAMRLVAVGLVGGVGLALLVVALVAGWWYAAQ